MAQYSKTGSRPDPTSQLTAHGESGQTGVLHVAGSIGPDSEIFLMGGEIIACNTAEDRRLLSDLLVAAGALDAEAMAVTVDSLDSDEDLADALVSSGAVEGGQVMEARSGLFRDNIAWALVSDEAEASFEDRDMVFPVNMQFGLDRDEVLGDVRSWRERIASVLELLGTDRVWVAGAQRPPGCDKHTWSQLDDGRTVEQLLGLLPPPRRDAAEKLSLWLQLGALMDPEVENSTDLDEGDTEIDPSLGTRGDADDYAKAAAGGFIKSYEILDKVDLSGMDVVGEEEPSGPPSMEAIEAIAFDDGDEYDTQSEVEDIDDLPLAGDTRPVAKALSFLEGGDLDTGDFEVFDDGSEDAELVVDDVSADSIVAVDLGDDRDGDDAGASASINVDELDTPFTREQLNDFHERISVFNNIFRIVFGTFAEHISPEKALQRFNALLGSGQRQYPELFKDLEVEADGTIAPSALVNNLSACPPGDYGSLLHQGLYELIFSHLYDAKDMLPGDAEMLMMEKIVVFERQLHQM